MVQCELCGKDTTLVNVLIEGVNLNACSDCGKHGRVITAKSTIQRDEEISEDISSDYDVKIKHARESRNLKQQECAQLLNIKESMLQKLETKKMRPSLELAKKIVKISKNKFKLKYDESRERPFDVNRLICDNTKAKKLLNWKPKISMNKGLSITFDWAKKNKVTFSAPFKRWYFKNS